jgi:aerobic-type carbon monoxide dehydrogenase small subunit (CoxS/CutS family)
VTPYDDTTKGVAWSRGWTTDRRDRFHYLGTDHRTTVAGAKVVLEEFGSQLQVVGDTCATCGSFVVYVDGHKVATVSAHASSSHTRVVLYTRKLGSTIARHTVELVTVKGSRHTVRIDGFAFRR